MENNIDFEEASKMWRINKLAIGGGCYRYICGATRKDGGKCQNKPFKDNNKCHIHFTKKVE